MQLLFELCKNLGSKVMVCFVNSCKYVLKSVLENRTKRTIWLGQKPKAYGTQDLQLSCGEDTAAPYANFYYT